MKAVRIFHPLSIQRRGTPVLEGDIDHLSSKFRFLKHPVLARAIQEMKEELSTYNRLVNDIPPHNERLDTKGKDTFNLLAWWKGNSDQVSNWALVLTGVLANSPNSCPPERVFSILEDTFDDDQRRAYADYLELSLMIQYNNRGR